MKTSESRLASARVYKEKNKEQLREWQQAYNKSRYADPERREKYLASKRETMKKYADKYKAYDRSRDKNKVRARNRISDLIRKGKLIRGACAICGSPNTDAHHEDYAFPLRIYWLCRSHHAAVHGGILTLTNLEPINVRLP